MNIVCSILAAGASRRLGVPKQLLRAPGSSGLVRSAAEAACASCCSRVLVIVGAHADVVSSSLAGLPLEVIANLDWSEGIAASIRLAAARAMQLDADALLLSVCDQPHLTAVHLDALCAAYEQERSLVASFYDGAGGVPALFPATYFERLLALRGDTGAAGILRLSEQVAMVPWAAGAVDVDTPSDAERYLALDAPFRFRL